MVSLNIDLEDKSKDNLDDNGQTKEPTRGRSVSDGE